MFGFWSPPRISAPQHKLSSPLARSCIPDFMESYRSPQVNPALRISAPRSLRPRDQRHAAEPTTRYTPPATFPIIPVELFNGQPVNQTERAPDPQRDFNEVGSSPSSDAESSIEPSSPQGRSRRFVGGFINGLRSIPQAMAKHNSRESLYAEYLAEAEAASRAASPRYRGESLDSLSVCCSHR